ncbi:hypothetical protein SUNI508_06558 [Seiridium unicorne]|uniref:Uncharacterized protein n=1 Tax=Seiridium unicorne TaxID=138068 RepID=A0ABR2V020_9PEZI
MSSQLDAIDKNTRPGSPYWAAAMMMMMRQLYGIGIISIESAIEISEFIIDSLVTNSGLDVPFHDYTIALPRMCFASITIKRRNKPMARPTSDSGPHKTLKIDISPC